MIRNGLAFLAIALASTPAQAEGPPAGGIWLEDLDLRQMSQEWGSAGKGVSVAGGPLTLKGKAYRHGVGTHARGEMMIDLKGAAIRFTATVGVDDETHGLGSVTFQVWVDGRKAAESGPMRGGDEPKTLAVDLSGARRMILRVGNDDGGNGQDHADWADAQLLLAPGASGMPEAIGITGEPPPIASGHPAEPAIHGPRVVGGSPGKPFVFRIPVTGQGPFAYSSRGLPRGLTLDPTGILSGTLGKAGTATVELEVRGPKGVARRRLALISGDRSVALTPPIGWSSWYAHGLDVDEMKVRAAADELIRSGLAAHGYQYINIDDGWEGRRGDDGAIAPNAKFGDMKTLADEIHAKGLRLGIYTSPGPTTCGGFEGSFGHEEQDAKTFAAWGVDYLKYDWCSAETVARGEGSEKYRRPYQVMGDALRKMDRDVVFSICEYGMGEVWTWGSEAGGNLWRTGPDIAPSYGSVSGLAFYLDGLGKHAGPGRWNDPDMLLPHALKPSEQVTQMTLWSLLAAPLMISSDLSKLDRFSLDVLSNDEVIDVDQDPMGKPAHLRIQKESREIWARELSDGTLAVGLFNLGMDEATVTARWDELHLRGSRPVRDLWRRQELGPRDDSFAATVPAHGAVLVKIGTPRPAE